MLLSGPVIEDVLFSPSDPGPAVTSQMARGSTLVVMSSIPVGTSREQAERLAAHGVAYVDAPVSGGERGAIDASLTIMAGGDSGAVARVRDVLGRLLYAFVLVECHSRLLYVEFTHSQGFETFARCRIHGFRAFQPYPSTGQASCWLEMGRPGTSPDDGRAAAAPN